MFLLSSFLEENILEREPKTEKDTEREAVPVVSMYKEHNAEKEKEKG